MTNENNTLLITDSIGEPAVYGELAHEHNRNEGTLYGRTDEAYYFAERMRAIRLEYEDDEEVCHEKMDDLMCSTLRNLGYGEGVDIFENTPKWHA